MKKKNNNQAQPEKTGRSVYKYQVTLISIFVLLILAVGLVSLLDTDPTVSVSENRTLKAYPGFSFETLFDGSFFRETEEAYNDTFPQRDFFVSVSKRMDELLRLKAGGAVLVQVNDATGEAGNDVLEGIRCVADALTEGRLLIRPCCTGTLREFASYVWDDTAAGRGEDRPVKQNDHAMDMIRYALYTDRRTASRSDRYSGKGSR